MSDAAGSAGAGNSGASGDASQSTGAFRCPLCGRTEPPAAASTPRTHAPRPDALPGAFRAAPCPTCGLIRTLPWPTRAQLAEEYDSTCYYGHSGKFGPLASRLRRALAGRRARALARAWPRGGSVLDVGCGEGHLLDAFAERGFRGLGLERVDLRWSRENPRLEFRVGRIEDLAEAGMEARFDAVVLWHVLEHLPEPDKSLAHLLRLTRPGGRLVVVVPNVASLQAALFGRRWFHLDFPRHLFHFDPPRLATLLRHAGWEVTGMHGWEVEQNVFGWLQGLLDKMGFPPGALYDHLRSGPVHPRRASSRALWWAILATLPLMLPLAATAALVEWALGRPGTIRFHARRPAAQDLPSQRAKSETA